jgi:hypothetical protein
MKLHGAVIKEQGVGFAVVMVKHHVVQSGSEAAKAAAQFRVLFPGMPIVLAGQDSRGRFQYRGRQDLIDFLASIHPSQIPWKEYTVSG